MVWRFRDHPDGDGWGRGWALKCTAVRGRPLGNSLLIMKRFAILSLPRSRTAWLSALFTIGDVYCWHDATAYHATVGELIHDMRNTPATHYGISDSAAVTILDDLVEAFPELRIAFIWRPVEEVIDSLARACDLPASVVRQSVERLEEVLLKESEKRDALHVQYDGIDAGIEELWRHFVPSIAFPVYHYDKLKQQKITVLDSVMHDAARGRLGLECCARI